MPRIFDNIELELLPVLRATLSKPIIDVIDCVLARHHGFGFAEEELDSIINYDIKYRMGRDTQDDDE